MSVRVSFCLFESPFKRFFAPTLQSQLSEIFRDSESLGKNNEKKCSHIWKLLLIKGVKWLRKAIFIPANLGLFNH